MPAWTTRVHWDDNLPMQVQLRAIWSPGTTQGIDKEGCTVQLDTTWEAVQHKQAVSYTATLRYFDKPVTLQVDTSIIGLGVAILQDDAPVAYASKTLTYTECWWTNIECETYALVFGREQFHTYLYGRHFKIESDRKPPEQIIHKNLVDTLARLQRMMVQLKCYVFELKFRPE